MSRGHGRLQRVILNTVNGTRYGCTVPQLAYVTYGIDQPTEVALPYVIITEDTDVATIDRLLAVYKS